MNPRRSDHHVRRGTSALAMILAVVVFATACGRQGSSTPGFESVVGTVSVDFDYVIPRGTGERLDRGERVDILPARIDAHVGQVLRITNQDTRGQLLGPFYVGAGETMTERFSRPGELVGACLVHADGRLIVSVTP
jgi:hypothetical protein